MASCTSIWRSTGNVRAGRVPAAEIENKTAYRWWDGAAWTPDIAQSVDVLRTAGGQQAFNVAYNPYIGKWTGIYSTNTLTAIAIAYADAPEGPFVDDDLDCTDPTIGPPEVFPVLFNSSFECYHATQHPEFDKNDRQTMFDVRQPGRRTGSSSTDSTWPCPSPVRRRAGRNDVCAAGR